MIKSTSQTTDLATTSTQAIIPATPRANATAHTTHATRDSILEMLTDDEVARVSTVETAPRLVAGDEYLDLEQLDKGVRHALGMVPAASTLLARKAVSDATWTKIVTQLVTPIV